MDILSWRRLDNPINTAAFAFPVKCADLHISRGDDVTYVLATDTNQWVRYREAFMLHLAFNR